MGWRWVSLAARLHVRQRLDDGALVGSGAIDVTPRPVPDRGPRSNERGQRHAFVYQRGSTRRVASRHGRDPTAAQPIRGRKCIRRRGVKYLAVAFCICFWSCPSHRGGDVFA